MSSLGNFVWAIADQLRGVYRPNQYGNVILPMTILRRLDCQMAASRDRMRELTQSIENPNMLAMRVLKECGLGYYNTSKFDLARIVADPDSLAANLTDYINGFSPNIDVFERFKFENEIATLAEKNRLMLVVRQFSEVDLHPDTVPNPEMGDLFEELIRKFAEASNEEAGEHFTPRDAIRLMVELLFAEDSAALTDGAFIRTIYDPTAGTGGMLSVAEDHFVGTPEKPGLNPDARLVMFGQEINDQSYAICKSDMIAKGQDATNIRLGDTLAEDKFADRTFDYCMSNPPYGMDWKAASDAVRAERSATGAHGRFAPGLPKIGDGQMLFLTHLAHKMRPVHDGGGRAGIVLNGSPLFSGGAGSGESEIRRYLLENDLVEAIVALPTNMFYNTGISTYIWILDNAKRPERVGKIQLIDGSNFYSKMPKNLGDKTREISEVDRANILSIYDAFKEQKPNFAQFSRIFDTTDFGYWTVTVERPLRLNFCGSRARSAGEGRGGPLPIAGGVMRGCEVFEALGDEVFTNREAFLAALKAQASARGIKFSAPEIKTILTLLSERDESADICTDRKGLPEPDPTLRYTENIPFGWAPPGDAGDSRQGASKRDAVIGAYFEKEIIEHLPDAWIDHTKTKAGYEIPFARVFRRDPASYDMDAVQAGFAADESEARELSSAVADFARSFRQMAQDQGWPVVPLRRAARIINGGTPSPEAHNWDGSFHWATPVDINRGDGFIRRTDRTLTELGLASSRLLPAGNVLISSRAPIGSVAMNEVDTAFNQGCKGLVVRPQVVSSACLAFQLMASKGLLESLGQGSTFMEINADKLASIPVVVPPATLQETMDFAGTITNFHRARRLFESLTEQARLRRRGMDMLVALAAPVDEQFT